MSIIGYKKYIELNIRVTAMKISYKKLRILLIKKEISPVMLHKDLNIVTGAMTKL